MALEYRIAKLEARVDALEAAREGNAPASRTFKEDHGTGCAKGTTPATVESASLAATHEIETTPGESAKSQFGSEIAPGVVTHECGRCMGAGGRLEPAPYDTVEWVACLDCNGTGKEP